MRTNEEAALTDLLKAIDQKGFEFDSWKIKASIILKKIFGDDDPKAAIIEQLNYNFSSWALRDSSGGKQNDMVKEKARKIIEASLSELTLSDNKSGIIEIIKNEISVDEFNSLMDCVENSTSDNVTFIEQIGKIAPSKKDQLLAQLLKKLLSK